MELREGMVLECRLSVSGLFRRGHVVRVEAVEAVVGSPAVVRFQFLSWPDSEGLGMGMTCADAFDGSSPGELWRLIYHDDALPQALA